MINILQEFLKGWFIGICVSAPVGPLGVLCIQRTLSRGRWHGVVTGIGATTSDIIYALLVGASMNFITDFINNNMIVIQIVGAIIICLFGVQIYKSKPEDFNRLKKHQIHTHHEKSKSNVFKKIVQNKMFHDYITAFGLCFSNPLIIFLFIGLFAQFHVMSSGDSFTNFITFIAILIGAFCWWLTLTYIIGHFRGNFKERGLLILNHITGTLLILGALITVIKSLLNYHNIL